jgi:hypothetical protein
MINYIIAFMFGVAFGCLVCILSDIIKGKGGVK